MAYKHLQTAYAGIQKPLQQEWEFVQRFTPDIGDAFGPVEEALWYYFLPTLFQGVGEVVPGQGVNRLPVKHTGLYLPDPTNTGPKN